MSNSKDDVFNISVTEILLIIMFSLLVAMVLLNSSLQEEVETNNETFDEFNRLTQQLIDVNNKLGFESTSIDPASIELNEAVAQMQALIKALKLSVESAEAEQVLAKMKLDDVWTSLSKVNESNINVPELLLTLKKLNKDLEACLSEKQELRAQLEGLTKKVSEQDSTIADLRKQLTETVNALKQVISDNQNLIGQVENLSNGLEFPPCWATPEGKAQYTYLVTIADDSLIVDSVYPTERRQEYFELMTNDYDEKSLTLEEFKNDLSIFYKTAVASVPECRFFVQVKDSTSSDSKKEYKQGLRTIESIFYKYLPQ
jgi:uncharacterized coiled-coil protein SlyX